MRRFKHWLEYQGVRFLFFLAPRLPLSWTLVLGVGLGKLTFSILRIRRRVALENLAHAFPEKSAVELKNIARRSYENFGMMMLEYFCLPELSEEELQKRIRFAMPKAQNPYEQALALGNGAICMTGHFGNWEYMGALVALMHYPMVYLYQEQNNPYVDALIREIRTKMRMPSIPRGTALRGILKALREKKFVALLADQDAGSNGIFINFLGRPAATAQGPAAFVLKSGAPIVFCVAIREPRGQHRVEAELLTFNFSKNGATTEADEQQRFITEAWTKILEKYIRQYPDHWFWMHRRWKTKKEK